MGGKNTLKYQQATFYLAKMCLLNTVSTKCFRKMVTKICVIRHAVIFLKE